MKHTCFSLLMTVLVAAGSLAAQTLDRGQIDGTVMDETGAVLPGVQITLVDRNTNFKRIVVTGEDGRYKGVLLPVGDYAVEAELHGFAPFKSDTVRLRVGQLLTVNITLGVARITETVEVVAPAEIAPSGVSSVLEEFPIVNLPINGRDYRDFALLSPTAQPIQGTRGTFRLGGHAGDYVQLNLDGADFTNSFFGEFFGSIETRNFTVPQEAVREFQVSSAGFGTEFGRSNGGMLNVVTKSGTNEFHGSGVYFLRHKELTWRDAFGNPPTGLVRHQFGGSLAGPIVKDKTFFFVAADLQDQTLPITVKFNRNVRGIAIPELGIADLASFEGQFPREQDISTALGKIDYNLSATQRFTSRVNFTRHEGTNIAGGPLILARATGSMEHFINQGFSSVNSLNSAFGTHFFAETKFQFSRETRPRDPQGTGPEVTISDTGRFGRSSSLPATQDMYRYQGSANFSYLRGRHDLKFGADFNVFNMRNNSFAVARNGAYTFPTLESLLLRRPTFYGQFFALGARTAEEVVMLRTFWQQEFAFYLQDQIQMNRQFSVTVGLRYDAQFNPTPRFPTAGQKVAIGKPNRSSLTFAPVPQDVPDDTNNWAGRFGFAYDFHGNGNFIVRGGVGLYYGRTPMIYFPNRGSGIASTTIFAPPFMFPGLVFPATIPLTIEPGSSLERLIPKPSIQYVDPDFQNPRVLNLNASVSQRVPGDLVLEWSYLLSESRGLHIGGFRSTVWDRNLNLPTRVDEFGRGINVLAGGRPDSTITRAEALASFGRGRYQAFVAQVNKRFSRRLQFQASYTLSSNKSNASTERDTEASFGPSDPFDLEVDYGTNELDVRHNFKSSFVSELPYQVTVSSIIASDSGLAFPVYGPTDSNGDGVTNSGRHPDRPVVGGKLLERFPFHQPSSFVWDFRLARSFHLKEHARTNFILEIFNLLGNANTFSDPSTNAIWGGANFRQRNRTLGPRIMQVGLRFDF